jgi:tetratricopeptide (TPR) repeat protein
MEREAKWAEGKSMEADFLGMRGSAAAALGQLKKAEELRMRAMEEFKRQDRLDNAGQALIGLAFRQAAYGKCAEAKGNAATALKLHRGKFILIGAATIYADCADSNQALALLNDGLKTYPKDTLLTAVFGPLIRTQVERKRGNSEEALKLAESVRRYDFGIVVGPYSTYIRGLTYLDLKKGQEAAAEFQRIIDRSGVDPMSELRPLAHVGLARAAAVTGDVAKARTSYQNFFALWKDADPDLPILIQARKEYEQLK